MAKETPAPGGSYFQFFDIIHFHDLFSHSLKASGRGKLHYLLAGGEGLEVCARDALEDDGKGDSGAWRILLPMFSAKSKTVSSNLHNTRDCPTITYEFRGGQS